MARAEHTATCFCGWSVVADSYEKAKKLTRQHADEAHSDSRAGGIEYG